MFLRSLSLLNFKNIGEEEFSFSPGVNVLLGNNGQGKTNVLDAIHYLSLCKSCFQSSDMQNIKHGEGFFMIHGVFEHDAASTDVYCGQKRSQKKIMKRNQKEYEKLADHIGLFPLVIVSPADSDLVNEGSGTRRKFLDGIIAQSDKLYLEYLIAYNRILDQRNALLRSARSQGLSTELLEVYNNQLVPFAQKIFEKRNFFIQEFNPLFNHYFEYLTGNSGEKPQLTYASKLHHSSMTDLLSKSFDHDRQLEYTTVGIHKDDLEFQLNGYAVKKFGSQGQQKSVVIALKLAQHHFIGSKKFFSPLLLLDDIFDKLDSRRVNALLKLITKKEFGQVFITDTDMEKIPALMSALQINAKLFTIQNGKKNILHEAQQQPAVH